MKKKRSLGKLTESPKDRKIKKINKKILQKSFTEEIEDHPKIDRFKKKKKNFRKLREEIQIHPKIDRLRGKKEIGLIENI